MNFEPKILGFLCNWCSYAGADLAGVSRIQYPPNLRVVRVMCSGRVDPLFIFNALEIGLDGILVLGCHPGDCHYLEGNYEEEKKFNMVEQFLDLINSDLSKRIQLDWVSASEGARFAEIVGEFTSHIKQLGPSPLGGDNADHHLLNQLKAIKRVATSTRMRSLVGRQRKITEQENVYGEVVSDEEFEEVFSQAIKDEYERSYIFLLLEKEAKSVKNLAKELGIEASRVLEHILVLKSRGKVDYKKIIKNTPLYTTI